MSSVTSNFFDDMTPEQIINWMLDKLTDDQIKTCLDQAGIKDTSVIERPEEPVFVPGASGGSGSGSGSGTDPGPQTTMELDQMRRQCQNKLVLIETVSGGMVSFYEFGANDEGDLKWSRNNATAQNFIGDTCNAEKNSTADEILDLDDEEKREMAQGLVLDSEVPEDVKRLATEYSLIGLEQPLDPLLLAPSTVEVSDPETTVYDQKVSESIKKQLSLDSVLNKNYPELYTSGMTKFPVFVHSVEDDGKISYISLILKDDNTFGFVERKYGNGLFLTMVKRDLKELKGKLEVAAATGWSKPNDYAAEIDTALSNWSGEKTQNQEMYNNILNNYRPIRLAQLRNSITTAFGQMVYNEYYSEMPEMNTYFSGAKPSPINPDASSKNVRDLDINELRERMSTLFGREYAETHEPFITHNKFGIKTVQYRKKTGPRPNLDAKNWTREDVPVFDEFGTSADDFELF
mgnify:FL=1|tara:strand:- start:986 stop:2368 length:1383 start_codon:yes stop_codon:yes gene_type:complete